MENGLNFQQQKFCHEYLLDFNATKAAIRAGYSEKAAYSHGHDLLKKPEIKTLITKLTKEIYGSIGLSKERIVSELAVIAFDSEKQTAQRLKALEVLLEYMPNETIKPDDSKFKHGSDRVMEALRRLKENPN